MSVEQIEHYIQRHKLVAVQVTAGIDWASADHAVAIVDVQGRHAAQRD